MDTIRSVELGHIEEPLRVPFGFKGGSLTGLWQVVVRITLDSGEAGMGLGVQSVLWAHPAAFAVLSEREGNERMLAVTRRALQLLRGEPFTEPPRMIAALLPPLLEEARRLLGRADVPRTFVLNALVPVDFALWQLWSARRGDGSFNALTRRFCPALGSRERQLGNIPLISYHSPAEEIRALLADGAYLLKIKIGSNPGGDGDPEAMLAWDTNRLREVHAMARAIETEHTDCGHPLYYLDANGRYPSRAALLRLLEAADAMGALERIALLEEPFPEGAPIAVGDLPVRVAADESAHSAEDARRLTRELGYRAIALKPIAKTLSVTFAMAEEALREGAACFCADLTVPPAMLDWNLHVAARLPRLAGLRTGVVESNGRQNYPHWARMDGLCAVPGAPWRRQVRGLYTLDDAFDAHSGLFDPLPGYAPCLQALT